MQSDRNAAETVAEGYYDSSDADNFYDKVWGGEDIHIGLYKPGLSIREASRLTVEGLAALANKLDSSTRVIDLGAGYGGAGRYLASTFGCHVTCLNLSEVQNEHDRKLNKEQGLDHLIDVVHGSYEEIPADDASFDLIWSQDAFLHSGRKEQVVKEIRRVLAPGGELVFTDPMQADDCPQGVLQAVYDRLSLESLASFAWYREALTKEGLEEVQCLEMTNQLRNHYSKVRESLMHRFNELSADISEAYLERMIEGLQNWVDAADKGYLAWGFQHYRLPG